jgi:hypothetical protein
MHVYPLTRENHLSQYLAQQNGRMYYFESIHLSFLTLIVHSVTFFCAFFFQLGPCEMIYFMLFGYTVHDTLQGRASQSEYKQKTATK